MEMLRPGGCFITHTAANNWCGHGFYQFSPELFFSALSPENGFKVERMIAHRVGPYGRWYEVSDPGKVRTRVEALTFTPFQLLVLARREKITPIFAAPPQQSDYSPRWDADAGGAAADPAVNRYAPSRPRLARFFPAVARFWNVIVNGVRIYHSLSLRNRKNFRPVPRP